MKKSIFIHNPRCSKSREAKEILLAEGIIFDTVHYLDGDLSAVLLLEVSKLLNVSFSKMVREKEEIYKELKLSQKNLSEEEWVKIILKHPVLLERPIFIHNNKAVIARPAELVRTIL